MLSSFCARMRNGLAAAALIASALGAGGCDITPAPPPASASALAEPPPPPPPPDLGELRRYQACQAAPRRVLSPRERCEIAALAEHCSPANDCLASCLSSPGIVAPHDGCLHVCFFGLHSGEPRPPGFAECEKVPGPSHIDSSTAPSQRSRQTVP